MIYPQVYHRACAHLVAFGGCGGDARWYYERRSILFISGQFPVKGKS